MAVDTSTRNSSNRVKFAYCRDIGKWTLSFVAKDKKIDEKDSCEYHFMESPFATTYDLLDLQHETWKFFDFETFQYQPADRFYMECADCKDSNYGDKCFPELEIQFCEKIAGGETCRSERERECKEVNGKNVCVCNEKAGLFGMHCEFLEPCERLELDMRTKPFAGDESVLPTDFTVLRNPHNGISVLNYRPVYISNGYVFTDDQVGKVLLIYLGRRWAMTLDFFVFMRFDLCWKVNRFKNLGELVDLCDHPSSEDLTSFLDNEGNGAFDTTDAELEECYENFTEALEFETLSEEVEFHGAKIFFDLNCYCRFYTFIPYYMSAPLDIGTPSDSVTPENLLWYPATANNELFLYRPDERETLDSTLVCSVCDDFCNHCLNGDCNITTGHWECSDHFEGSLCEKELTCLEDGVECQGNATCLENGVCDCPDSLFGVLCENSM